MKEHNLITILKTFSRAEFKEFEKFLSSPFFNEGRNYLPFVKELKKYYPGFTNPQDIKAKVFTAIYGAGNYSGSLVNTTLSRVLKLAEEYLSYKAYSNNRFTSRFEYIQELFNRELFSIAEKSMKHYAEEVSHGGGITDSLVKARMDYEILNVQLSYKNDKIYDSLKSAVNQTDYHIRFTLMRLAHFVHNLRVNNLMYNTGYDKTLVHSYLKSLNLKKLYAYFKNNESGADSITFIYILWISGITEPKSENYFFEMKEQVFKQLELFHHHEKYNLLQALEAVAWIKQQEVNREKYQQELYSLYKMRVEKNILSPDNTYMRIILFRAILIASFYYLEWEFIEGLVKKCIPLLRENQRENMRNYALAHIHYHKRSYDTALMYNNRINFEMFAFKFDTRLLQFQIYYELNYFDEAYSLVDTHRHFIKKNKTVSGYYKELHTNFLAYYTELLRLKQGLSAAAPGLLYRKLSKINNVISKKFLLEKIKEIEEGGA